MGLKDGGGVRGDGRKKDKKVGREKRWRERMIRQQG